MNKLRQWVSGIAREIAREIAKEEIKNTRPAEISVKIPIFNDKGEAAWRQSYWNGSTVTTGSDLFYGERPPGNSGYSCYNRAYKEYSLQDFIDELNKDEKIRWIIPACKPAHFQVKK